MSYLTSTFGNRVILMSGASFGMIAFFWSLFFVKFPVSNASTRSKDTESIKMKWCLSETNIE